MDKSNSGSFHEVGGIAFEIPPLPDEFDLGGPDIFASASNGTVAGARDIKNEEEFGNFSISLPDVPSSSLPHSQEISSHRLEQKNDGGFNAFSGFQSNSTAPELVVPPLPETLTDVTASNVPADLRKAQDLRDQGEFWGFKAAGDSQVSSTPLPGDVWSTVPGIDASVEFTAFKDSSEQHSGCTTSVSNIGSSEGGPGPVDTNPPKASADNIGFADFSNFAAASTQPATDDNFGDFTSAEKQPWPNLAAKGNDAASLESAALSEDFGAVTAVSRTHATATRTATTATAVATTAAAPTATEFRNADLGSSKGPTSASNVASTTVGSSNSDFGEFGTFTTGPPSGTNVVSSTTEAKNMDDFGKFGSFGSPTAVSNTEVKNDDDFGEFGSFGSPAAVSNTEVQNDDDFGEFGSFTGPASVSDGVSSATKSKIDDFGDFGSFSGPTSTSNQATVSATDDFGNFGSFPTTSPVPMSPPAQQPKAGKKLVPSDVMLTCFPATSTAQEEGLNCFKQLAHCVKEGTESQQLWARLEEEAGSSGSLYKWVQSFLQDHFYSAIKVDPMLAPIKSVTGSFSAGGLVGDDPLSPAFSSSALLAAEFGFERALTTATVPQISPEVDAFGWGSGTANNAPTLLDLSRPESPLPEANQVPLLDKELLGLDFTSVDPNNTGATKESTTPTPWADSEAHASDATEGQVNQGTPQTVEQQLLLLGLDTTKTTWWTSKDDNNLQLSLAAKTVLDELPNLDFLLAETLLVST